MKIIESNLNFRSLSPIGQVKRIIYHHAEAINCTIEDIHRWHLNNGWSGCGYHFFIRKDGSIYRGRPENSLGAHTSGHNTGSLGICFEGSFNKETMTDEQLKSGQELTTYLCDKYNLLKANVYKHKDFNSTDCPGVNFPYEKLRKGGSNNTVENTTLNIIAELQNECNKQGFSNQKVDGIYGVNTLNGCPTVKRGARGNITKIIQRILGVNADGIFGRETENAVKSFQLKNGLSVDGIVGKNTWRALLT